jgi:hypothetical protein
MKKKYIFHWLCRKPSTGYGTSPEDALTRLGYGNGAIRALDYYEEVENPSTDTEENHEKI